MLVSVSNHSRTEEGWTPPNHSCPKDAKGVANLTTKPGYGISKKE